MNILIVGNGFDLSHYLPTKYDHFMDVMKAIEEKDLNKPLSDVLYSPFDHPIHCFTKYFEIKRYFDEKTYQMNFDELFGKCRENWFVSKTKDIYQTEDVLIAESQIKKIQSLLKQNGWYQYFKDHVKEVKTWIDFEKKIEEVLIITAQCLKEIEAIEDNTKAYKYFETLQEVEVASFMTLDKNEIKIKKVHLKILNFFKLCSDEKYTKMEQSSSLYALKTVCRSRLNFNPEYCVGKKIYHGFDPTAFLAYLYKQLDDFIEIFNLYLELIVDKLKPKMQFKFESEDWIQPDYIFSFNYTNTFKKFYESEVKTEFLHGHFGEEQNIVLGISDLVEESLKNLKAYGFTKYHQKLFKDTEYLFLDESTEVVKKIKKEVSMLDEAVEYFKFHIWGHSLDSSDKEYILDLFRLNDYLDRKITVTVYYFDKSAKFSLLNNLLAILGKDTVEKWMKNKWLIFEKNPEVKLVETIPEQTV